MTHATFGKQDACTHPHTHTAFKDLPRPPNKNTQKEAHIAMWAHRLRRISAPVCAKRSEYVQPRRCWATSPAPLHSPLGPSRANPLWSTGQPQRTVVFAQDSLVASMAKVPHLRPPWGGFRESRISPVASCPVAGRPSGEALAGRTRLPALAVAPVDPSLVFALPSSLMPRARAAPCWA